MSEMSNDGASKAAGRAHSPYYQAFFLEAGDNLTSMEQKLLTLDLAATDAEALNALFRCVHSVKGGAASFGFQDVAALAHQIEALLDKLRRHALQPTAAMVDLLLAASDALRALLGRHQGSGGAAVDNHALLASLHSLCGGPAADQAVAAMPVRLLEMTVTDTGDASLVHNLAELFRDIAGLGRFEPLDAGRPASGAQRFKLSTHSSDRDLLDLFSFHAPPGAVRLAPLGQADRLQGSLPGIAPATPAVTPAADPDADPGQAEAPPATRAEPPASAPLEAATLRVSADKLDQLIKLVADLALTQARLARHSQGLGAGLGLQLSAGLADLQGHTRDLQQAVMAMRMIPMAGVFNRFPRMLRDLAARLGKQVVLVTQGERTELDRGLVEQITDPLTHLVRNSCDHGIELPAERLARGKPEQGTLTLRASQQGNSVVIEVRDDGRGLNRHRLILRAREIGIAAADSMSDQQVWQLIFAPGLSTAQAVTDISGRGVGMDVVQKNIQALGGTVDIESAEGQGMSVTLRLPLTLAVLDGLRVGVADECCILPLQSVLACCQIEPGQITAIAGHGRRVALRNQDLPLIDLAQHFGLPRHPAMPPASTVVVVEADGARAALLVDRLLGQQQVVVKRLDAHFRQLPDVSGATLLADGRLALILDIGSLLRHGRD